MTAGKVSSRSVLPTGDEQHDHDGNDKDTEDEPEHFHPERHTRGQPIVLLTRVGIAGRISHEGLRCGMVPAG
jgi:hypothetical protein